MQTVCLKMYFISLMMLVILALLACSTPYQGLTNGKKIYTTGRNEQGVRLLDEAKSLKKAVRGCLDCHGI